MKSSVISKTRTRIKWIDIAKGIAILSMIWAHGLAGNGRIPYYESTIICSFHMPLFFILSGYTTRPLDDCKIIYRKVYYLVKKLYIPIILVVATCTLERAFFGLISYSQIIRVFFSALIYAQPTDFLGHHSIDAMWFLVTLFWAKILYYFIRKTMNLKFAGIVLLVLTIIFHYVSLAGFWIQSLDLVPIACFFMWIGSVWAKYQDMLKERQLVVLSFLFLVWLIMIVYDIKHNTHVDMAMRSFPLYFGSVSKVIAGTYLVAYLGMKIETNKLGSILNFIGQNTLSLLIINTIDFFAVWAYSIQGVSSVLYTVSRFTFDIVVFLVWYYLWLILRKNFLMGKNKS